MDTINEEIINIQPLKNSWYQNRVSSIDMLRLDKIHPVISGNKWFKLKYNVQNALDNKIETIITFGGGFSNHLVATAAICKLNQLYSIGIVRGVYKDLTPTLLDCLAYGMQLIFVTKEEFNNREEDGWIKKILKNDQNYLIIPDGGSNEAGRKGAESINKWINDKYSHVAISIGTGTTFIGIANHLKFPTHILGFAPFKHNETLNQFLREQLQNLPKDRWDIFYCPQLGGFGKWNNELIAFMNNFYKENNIHLDIIYTSKMMFSLQQLIINGYFNAEHKILCIHTGGLQGNISLKESLIF